ncbi:8140_t:CDS:2, partial [Racocetra fulgida]
MDYSIRISNLNHSTSHFGSLNSTPALPPNNTGRKRPRSNSMNKSDQTQKTARLLSPPRQRGSSSTSLPSPPLACNEVRLTVQDFEPSDLMDCDNTQFDEILDAEMVFDGLKHVDRFKAYLCSMTVNIQNGSLE